MNKENAQTALAGFEPTIHESKSCAFPSWLKSNILSYYFLLLLTKNAASAML